MRFQCPSCKFPVKPLEGVQLVDAVCPKCLRPLDLTDEERSFEKFELLEMLGSGGFGTVYKVKDVSRDQLFTLKLMQKGKVTQAEQLHLLRQVHSSREIHHPNVVAAHDFGQNTDYWYLVSDYVDGDPLNRWSKRIRPNWNGVLKVVARIAEVLQHVHEQGFIHRDLKPGNIIISPDSEPHVIDFGLCVCLHDSELMAIERYRAARQALHSKSKAKRQLLLGTPGYAAPEQLQGDPFSAAPSSDLYSIGVILFELFMNHKPDRGLGGLLNGLQLRRTLRRQGLTSEVAREISSLCMLCISKKNTARPQSASDIAERCREISVKTH